MRRRLGRDAVALERPPARQELERDDREGVEVARRRRALALRLLGRQVATRSRARSRSASASRAPRRSRCRSRRRGRGRCRSSRRFAGFTSRWTTPSGARRRARAPPARATRAPGPAAARPRFGCRSWSEPPREVLHDDERPLALLADVVDRDDVRVAREPRDRERLAREPLAHRLVLARSARSSTLIATARPSVVSVARKISPMPPRPIGWAPVSGRAGDPSARPSAPDFPPRMKRTVRPQKISC